jgi:hypothetical protein
MTELTSTPVVVHPHVGRISTAWRNSFDSDRRAVLTLAGLSARDSSLEWRQLNELQRERIVRAVPHLRQLAEDFAGA